MQKICAVAEHVALTSGMGFIRVTKGQETHSHAWKDLCILLLLLMCPLHVLREPAVTEMLCLLGLLVKVFPPPSSGPFSGFDDGLRRRNIPSFEAANLRRSDEEDEEEEEEEEVEFKLAEKKKEEKSWFSLNKCIVGALVLLFLGSLFLSGTMPSATAQPASLSLLFMLIKAR